MRLTMSPGLWLALMGTLGGAVVMTSWKNDESAGEGGRSIEEKKGWSQGGRARSNAEATGVRGRRQVTKKAQVLFKDQADDFMFFEDQIVGKSEKLQSLYDSWKGIHTRRVELREAGLGPNHPQITSLSDKEVLLGNRLNQQIRNESQ